MRAFGSFAAALCLAATLIARPSVAAAPLVLESSPILGADAPSGGGWMTCTVRVRNTTSQPLSATLELVARQYFLGDNVEMTTRAPLSVAASGTVLVQLPTHGLAGSPSRLELRAVNTEGVEIAKVDPGGAQALGPMLFDLSNPSRVSPVLAGRAILARGKAYGPRYSTPALVASAARVDPSTGDPVLPDRAAGYSAASVILARTSALSRLPAGEMRALADWIMSGGALAVVVDRPEDLDGDVLTALLGGPVQNAEVPSTLKGDTTFWVPEPAGSFGTSGAHGVMKTLAPSTQTATELTGYAGSNLRASPWGASSTYGLGEVHLLAFDPARESILADPWTQHELVALVRHAWDRGMFIAMPHARSQGEDYRVASVRRHLDPNEGTRWTVGVSAILLLIYAVLAGPVSFHLARKKNRPLRALAHLPLWSMGTILTIVFVGMLGKGIHGRARRLTFVEAGAGMSRATATRFRGYYVSSSDELGVRPMSTDSVLDIVDDDEDTQRTLVVDADGARLEQFRSKPWKTVLVREEGFIQLAAGISIVETDDDDYIVKNRAARDLLGVIVKVPGRDAAYFPVIKDGSAVRVSKAPKTFANVGKLGGAGAAHVLGDTDFEGDVGKAADRLGKAWTALRSAAGSDTDWWPHDVPVLIGALDGGEGKTQDGGLNVDVDQVLVRVVGVGGVP